MTTDLTAYCDDLLLALREREVPGRRIGEALAEVQSHVAESGQDPQEAFGPADAYADELAAALAASPGPRGWDGPTWGLPVAYGVGGFVAAQLVLSGLLGLLTDRAGFWGLPAGWLLGLGLVVLFTGAAQLHRLGDRVLDPRSGQDMAGPLPRRVAVLLALPLVLPVVLAVPVLALTD